MKVISCFSYKGGSGRTVAAANIAAALASCKKVAFIKEPLKCKVVILDLDVFSAGTHSVFEIKDIDIDKFEVTLQDFLLKEMTPSDYLDKHSITLAHPLMDKFADLRGGRDYCDEKFTLLPSKPTPDLKFNVAKYHENVLFELIEELEYRDYDYAIIDGESGTRSMADIALRLSDAVLMFFRLTWQHIAGTLNSARLYEKNEDFPPFHFIPTVVPVIGGGIGLYNAKAPSFIELKDLTEKVPNESGLNEFVTNHKDIGRLWVDKICIHDSLLLKASERILVYDTDVNPKDQAGKDYYQIAAKIKELFPLK
jgi:MinD-like ATPase involved in chromosome partitioning or flagellar assembly